MKVCQNQRKTTPSRAAISAIVTRSLVENRWSTVERRKKTSATSKKSRLTPIVPYVIQERGGMIEASCVRVAVRLSPFTR